MTLKASPCNLQVGRNDADKSDYDSAKQAVRPVAVMHYPGNDSSRSSTYKFRRNHWQHIARTQTRLPQAVEDLEP